MPKPQRIVVGRQNLKWPQTSDLRLSFASHLNCQMLTPGAKSQTETSGDGLNVRTGIFPLFPGLGNSFLRSCSTAAGPEFGSFFSVIFLYFVAPNTDNVFCLFCTELYRIRYSELTTSVTLSMQCEQLLAFQVLTKCLRVFSDISIILSKCVSSLWSFEEGWQRYMVVCIAWHIKSIITLASGIIHERSVNNSRKWHHQRSAFCSFYILHRNSEKSTFSNTFDFRLVLIAEKLLVEYNGFVTRGKG
jgi:hypothetical protein